MNRGNRETVLTCPYPRRFGHACHETRDRHIRSIASWQEVCVCVCVWGGGGGEGGLEGKLSAIVILNTVENHEWTIYKKRQKEMCLLKPKIEVICEQF